VPVDEVVVTVAVVTPPVVVAVPTLQGLPARTVKVTGSPDVTDAVMVKLELTGLLAGALKVIVLEFPVDHHVVDVHRSTEQPSACTIIGAIDEPEGDTIQSAGIVPVVVVQF
jgi:hypothetical protein